MAKTMKFKLLQGTHAEAGKPKEVIDDEGNKKLAKTSVYYKKGEVIETDIDLAKKFNIPHPGLNTQKFQRLSDNARPTYKENSRFNTADTQPPTREKLHAESMTGGEVLSDDEVADDEVVEGKEGVDPGVGEDTLDVMTVAQLKQHAAANDIDLTGITHKADIIAAIRNAE